MDAQQHEWWTVPEVADYFRVTEETVRRWIRAGELPALLLGERRAGYRIRQADIDRFTVERYGPGVAGKEHAA